MTLETAPKAVAQPQRAVVAFRFTESEAAKYGLLARWQSARQRRQRRDEKRRQAQDRLSSSISRLIAKAEAEQWSQRQLAAKIGVPETTFRRIRDQKVHPLTWLPRIEAALARLDATQTGKC